MSGPGTTLIRGARVYTREGLKRADVTIEAGCITAVGRGLQGDEIVEARGLVLSPGFVDLDAEACPTLDRDAAGGGFTTVCVLPGAEALLPPEPAVELLRYGWLTRDAAGLAVADIAGPDAGCCGYTDGEGEAASTELMRQAMTRCAAQDALLAARCRDQNSFTGGCVHDGFYARLNGLRGIPSASERRQLERDLTLLRRTGCRYLMRRVSCRESLTLLADARGERLSVACAVSPWHLLLCDMEMADEGRFRLDPPLRDERDRDALLAALNNGLIDCLCSAHSPRSPAEKAGGLAAARPGAPALAQLFAALHTKLVLTRKLRLERLLELLTYAPARVLGRGCGVEPGLPADLTLLDPAAPGILTGGTPLDGLPTTGAVVAVWSRGRRVR